MLGKRHQNHLAWNKSLMESASLGRPEGVEGGMLLEEINFFFSYHNQKWIFFPQDHESLLWNTAPKCQADPQTNYLKCSTILVFPLILVVDLKAQNKTLIKISVSWRALLMALFWTVNETSDLCGSFKIVIGWSRNRANYMWTLTFMY